MFMPHLNREERYFRKLMEADAVVRPALIREWCRRDRVLGERLTRMLTEFLRPEDESAERRRSHRIAV
ncbi:MAG: hypothetical protein ACO3DQ_07795 [Cephaloticoccus sp.]|jgi:hypothetical protein